MKIRANSVTLFRLFFIALFFLMGICGLSIILLEQYAGITIIATELEADREAIYAISSFIGILGLVTSFLMFYLMQERRDAKVDRRQRTHSLSFTDRRGIMDRRSLQSSIEQ